AAAGQLPQGRDSGLSPAGTNTTWTHGLGLRSGSAPGGRSPGRSRQRLRRRPMRSGGRVGAFAHWVALAPPRGERSPPPADRVSAAESRGPAFARSPLAVRVPWLLSPDSVLSMQEKDASPPGFLPSFQHFATQAIHAGQEPEQWTSRAVVPPISLATTFKQGAPGQHSGFEYSRSGNPTRNCLEKAVATLDGAKYSLAFASGLAATVTITHLLKAGDHIICMDDVYGETSCSFQRPLALGADICMYSATKYMNGHSDVVMGLVSLDSESLHSRLRFLQNSLGAVPSPLDCYLCNRGLKTLQVRMEKHFENGMAVAQFLESNPRVEKVIYPVEDLN
ncbi:hypothetical protein HPG69_011047, partial [Diceros bicornis minor]